ncbi:MAG: class II aldolase/adducin family protein, partial [Firmicutes bacterium]|nr:class II aldolase/adducin family protein [Bacillota bacterium]
MTENDIRSSIIAAGIRLLDTGLVARTWGNISARLSQREFIITPSGRNYRTTEPQDLVRMDILDLS